MSTLKTLMTSKPTGERLISYRIAQARLDRHTVVRQTDLLKSLLGHVFDLLTGLLDVLAGTLECVATA